MRKTKRFMCMILVVAMVVGIFPANLLASEPVGYEAALVDYGYDELDMSAEIPPMSLGMVGFEYGFDSDPAAMVKISVQLAAYVVDAVYEDAHAFDMYGVFYTQLNELNEYYHDALGVMGEGWFEIVSVCYVSLSEVVLYVPAGMVGVVAALPGVFGVWLVESIDEVNIIPYLPDVLDIVGPEYEAEDLTQVNWDENEDLIDRPDEMHELGEEDMLSNDFSFDIASDYLYGSRDWIQPQPYGDWWELRGLEAVRPDPIEGVIENVVILISFADEDPTITPVLANRVESTFNGPRYSLSSYMYNATYGRLTVNSTILGMNDAMVFMYQDIMPRGHFLPHTPDNPNGFTNIGENREHVNEMLRRAVAAMDGTTLPNDRVFNSLNPLYFDSVTFVLSEGRISPNTSFWPHRSHLDDPNAKINDLRVGDYSLVFFAGSTQLSLSVIAHELLHVLSAPDLYRYHHTGHPMGQWDVMASTRSPIYAFPSTHILRRYLGLGDPHVEITNNGTFTIYPRGTRNRTTSFAIPIEGNPYEFILIEYRHYTNPTPYDNFVTGEDHIAGLIIKRINTSFIGNAGSGEGDPPVFTDEIYIFRPNTTIRNAATGLPLNASLSQNSGSTSFGSAYGTGYNGIIYTHAGLNTGIVIYDVSALGDGGPMTFSVSLPSGQTGPSVNINDANLSATFELEGAANDTVTFNTSALPDGVNATVANGVITVTGTRPSFGLPAISGSFNLIVTRNNASSILTVVVNLTPLAPGLQTVSFAAGANANIVATVNGNVISSGSQVIGGSTVVFTATPNAGFEMSSWAVSGGVLTGVNTDLTRSVVVGAAPVNVSVAVIPEGSEDVSSWVELWAAINNAPEGVPTAIRITDSFMATGNTITIPANRNIILVSSNTVECDTNIRTITQNRNQQRHFNVGAGGSLTLCQNITLCGDELNRQWTGGVRVTGGGMFIMNSGSSIENITNTAVTLVGNGPEASGLAHFIMLGGAIQHNHGMSGAAGVSVGSNAIFEMEHGSLIAYNSVDPRGTSSGSGGVSVNGGAFIMRGGSIAKNSAHYGGVRVISGIFTMYDGSIVDNSHAIRSAVAISDVGIFVMNGGIINNNAGHGVRMTHSGTMTMVSGEISHNAIGGVIVEGASALFTMYGGSINGNNGDGATMSTGSITMNGGTIGNNVGRGVRINGVQIHAGGAFTMNGGTISGNIDGGVRLYRRGAMSPNAYFIMNGGTISNNTVSNGNGGAGVYVELGVFTMNGGTISNNIVDAGATAGGGGVFQSGGTINITSGNITGNSAPRGGGVYVRLNGGSVGGVDVMPFNMAGGLIANNHATYNGGGIYTIFAYHPLVNRWGTFNNLNIGQAVIFTSNTAGNGSSAPPERHFPNIATTSASIWGNPINNYDINFTGRLGEEHGVQNWAELRAEVNAAPANTPVTIYILTSFAALEGHVGNAITIPANRQITLVSSNQTPGEANIRNLTQLNTGQRHFIVNGSLTLGQNITLTGGDNAGGIQVAPGGAFSMGHGSGIVGGQIS